ncbi:MAG TPA: copper-binding protein [Roseateles sp.]|nr:copper-binding protein [Roseateles sp.]
MKPSTQPESANDMKLIHLLLVASSATALGAQAQTAPTSGAENAAHHSSAPAAPPSEGEVRRIDREQGKLTLRHGPLDNLGMPAMTMVFRVADPKMLNGLKEGDKIKFTAEKVNGALTLTALQKG